MVKLPLSMEYALLGFLRDGASYPYQVHQRLKQTAMLHLVWRLKQRQTYALLERLEAEGCLASETAEQGRRPPRHMLRLTAHGIAMFRQWVVLPVEHGRDFRQEFMAKLYFAQQEGAATAAALIERQRVACRAWLQEFQVQLRTGASDEILDQLVIQFRIGQLEAILTWLDRCDDALATIAVPE
jgi:DNA-binding PadR family transcriptional regulator